jgi:hypothetical protein
MVTQRALQILLIENWERRYNSSSSMVDFWFSCLRYFITSRPISLQFSQSIWNPGNLENKVGLPKTRFLTEFRNEDNDDKVDDFVDNKTVDAADAIEVVRDAGICFEDAKEIIHNNVQKALIQQHPTRNDK